MFLNYINSCFVHRRPQHILRSSEHVCAHYHVRVLLVGRTRPQCTEILVVEEIFDHPSNVAILGYHGSRIPVAVHRLQLPESVRLVDRHARRDVLLPFQGVLQTTIFEIVETKGKKSNIITTTSTTPFPVYLYKPFSEITLRVSALRRTRRRSHNSFVIIF